MSIYKYLKKLIFISIFTSFTYTAAISGNVYDQSNKYPLIGATVLIEELGIGTITDVNGKYELENIESCASCIYTIKIMYIGYEDNLKDIAVPEEITNLNFYLSQTAIQGEDVIVTGQKRQDKVTDAPAAIEIVSASDIKKEESTNLGSYLKGIKGVDFTSSGINNYSISVRGFNSSFTTRLLTLTDGRIANIPALRVINYSTIPQSSKDIENIEIVLGPSTALYGANAHSGVVNITSKSPADSEGLDLSFSSSIFDNRDLYKFNGRFAKKVNRKLSYKISAMYLEAYEWEFISEEEYKLHTYPYSGNKKRINDGKDNNPWSGGGGDNWHLAKRDSITLPDGSIQWRYIGNGEANDTGDPDGDGYMGEDWYNGYDDDGDGLIDEDYFFANGIDDDGDCPGDTNGDGCICCANDYNVDEEIDWTTDEWYDGADNNGDGQYDETRERYSGQGPFYLPNWQTDIEFEEVIVFNGRKDEWILNQYGDTIRHNDWYNEDEPHLRGIHYYDEDSIQIYFDVFVYDFGDDGIPGDNAWIDLTGDGQFTSAWEGGNLLIGEPVPSESCFESPFFGNGICDGLEIGNSWNSALFDCGLDGLCPGDDGYTTPDYGEGNGVWDNFDWDNDGNYTDGDLWDDASWAEFSNGEWILINDNGDGNPSPEDAGFLWEDTYPAANFSYDSDETLLDCGQDGLCPGDDGYIGPDLGEGDNILTFIDSNELDGTLDLGDGCFGCDAEPFTDTNNNGYYDEGEPFVDTNNDGLWTVEDYKDNFQYVGDINGDGLDDYPDFEVKNSKIEIRFDYDPNRNTTFSFQTGISKSKTQQVTGTGRYIADGYLYTYYQLRGRYKNWFTQLYMNSGHSGNTRGYLLGNHITDRSKNYAFQLQYNNQFNNTKLVWGLDVFRTVANTNGSVLNDGPNGYDNDGDDWFLKANDIDDDFDSNDYWDSNGNGQPDPGEPGVNEDGFVYADGIDNDGDSQDLDGDGYPYFQEIYMNTDPNDPSDYPSWVSPAPYTDGVDEMIDEDWCGDQEYYSYVGIDNFSGFRDGRIWTCSEGVDEPNEFLDVTSTEMGLYFQTKTNPNGNKKWDIIVAARFDHHDQLDEDIQFSPKFGVFYRPYEGATFRMTYGKAYNTPSAINLYTDLFIGRRGLVEYYLRGNRDGTPYKRAGNEFNVQPPQIEIDGQLYYTGASPYVGYWDNYKERVNGAPYFLTIGDNEFIGTPDHIPLDTSLYTIWVPELNDTGRIYTAYEALTIKDVDPIKTEKIQTFELGFKGFLSERIHATVDYYVSFYEDFFSSPTVITPLVVDRVFDSNGNDITSFDNINVRGMLPVNDYGSNPPYGTQWDGLDNDNDWYLLMNENGENDLAYYSNNSSSCGVYSSCFEISNPIYHNIDTNGDDVLDAFTWYEEFGWDGVLEEFTDINNNGTYDYGEVFVDQDGSGTWNCIGCEAEWGFVDYITCGGTWAGGYVDCIGDMATGDTLGFTIYQPEDVIDNQTVINSGNLELNSFSIYPAQFWQYVGVDEFSAITGLSEAELITSPIIDANGNNIVQQGFSNTPLHSILAPLNYGEVNMSGIDFGLTYFLTEYNLIFDTNFSFYSSTEYYNSLTKKNDPINAPKFKMNASMKWDSPFGSIGLSYRHVDRFLWKDGLWKGYIGPYDLVDLNYNYKINDYLEFNLTAQNIFDDRHKEMIGGAIMGRQLIIRINASM